MEDNCLEAFRETYIMMGRHYGLPYYVLLLYYTYTITRHYVWHYVLCKPRCLPIMISISINASKQLS